ncbi:MAG: hypothetical protein KDB61_05395, partial [Planctomycetes bacterium]|nr:hypothetical protein [Planctomycetota bacterium]
MCARLASLPVLLLLIVACHSVGPDSNSDGPSTPVSEQSDPEPRELPEGWLEGSAPHFSRALDTWKLPAQVRWSQAGLERLRQVLLEPTDSPRAAELSVRAALLLALDSSPE